MSNSLLARRPRLAYPFTVLTAPGQVRLVAGEDQRYTLSAPELDRWLPPLLERMQGKATVGELLAALKPGERDAAMQILANLYGERVLVDGSAADAHAASRYRVIVAGSGALCKLFAEMATVGDENNALVLLCQDRLDYEEALSQQRRCCEAGMPLLWASYGALSRAYVGPLFLPDAGPCFGCLLGSFQRLSPAPEIYDDLREHVRQGKPIAPVEFPREGLLVLQGLIEWKLREAERPEPSPGLYRLHVVERERFEVSTHRVFADPHCPNCGKERQ